MTTEVTYPHYDFKISARNKESTYKILLKSSEPETFVRIERYGRGGGARGKYRKIREMYIDDSQRIFAGFEAADKDGSGTYYEYAIIGKLQVSSPKVKEAA